MSVPATNAFPPAPRSTSARTASSASARSHASKSASYIANVIALCASGRSKVTHSAGPRSSVRTSPLTTGLELGVATRPASRSTSAVCSPSSGAARRTVPGVSESFTGIPRPRTVPSSGCSIVTSISRARVCGSANTSA